MNGQSNLNNRNTAFTSTNQVCVILFFCLLSFSGFTQVTQKLVGTGSQNGGSLFSVNTDGSNPVIWRDFAKANNDVVATSGHERFSKLTSFNNELWGLSTGGGLYNDGTIFKLSDGTDFEIVHTFNGSNGRLPTGQLVVHDGKFWGMTRFGGDGDDGVIFTIESDGSNFTIMHEFDYTNSGANPYEALVLANDVFWGVSEEGGTIQSGTIFNIDPVSGVFTKVHDFSSGNGAAQGGLVPLDNKLWGLTMAGGTSGDGVIYTWDLENDTLLIVHEFDGTNGERPIGNLALIDNKLWGTTQSGGSTSDRGTIFTIETDGSGFTQLRDFDNTNGSGPFGSLVQVGSEVWGTTSTGGTFSNGVIYRIGTNGTGFEATQIFDNIYGDAIGPLISSDNAMYGITENVIYEVDITSGVATVLYEFADGSIYGATPYAAIVTGDSIFGVTEFGGASGNGIIYSVDNRGENFNIIHEFSNEGQNPVGKLLEIEGKFYGVTNRGGNNWGTIYSINTDGSEFTTLHTFTVDDGRYPNGSLIYSNGKIWGMTKSGGTVVNIYTDFGVIFSINPDGSDFTVVHEFDRLNGHSPDAGLIESNGKLWGVTSNNHNNPNVGGLGVLFSLDTTGANFTVHHSFETSSGSRPEGSLVESNGKLWGLASEDGAFGAGSIFSVDLDGSNYTEVRGFNLQSDGGNPSGTLLSYDGKLWGLTKEGGVGKVFSLDPADLTFQNIYDLEESVGGTPTFTELAVIEISKTDQDLSFTASDKTYGDEAFQLDASSDSETPIDYMSSDESVMTVSGSTATIIGAGSATITASQDGDDYLNEVSVEQTFNVATASLSITANDASKAYGEANPTFTAIYDGFVYSDSAETLDVAAVLSTTADETSDAGTYDITVTEADDANYQIAFFNGTLTVEKAILTATADDQTKVYGEENPDLTIMYEGFVNEDTENDLDESPVASTSATAASGAGEYPIELSTATDNNYSVQTVDGTLTVSKAPLTASADDFTINEGDDLPTLTISYIGFVNDDTEADITAPGISTNAPIPTVAGEYNIVLEGGDADNYEISLENGVLTVLIVTGLREAHESVKVFPNPAADRIYFQTDQITVQEIMIHDMKGQVVKTIDGMVDELNVGDLNPGIYFIHFINGEEIAMLRFIKK